MAPSISLPYCPSDEEAERFWQAELQNGKVSTGVPDGFPQKLRSSFAWKGADIEDKQSEWQLDLTSDEIDSVNAALAAFEAKHTDLSDISASSFALPAPLIQRLRGVSDDLYDGLGFQIIHGLDPTKYTPRQNIIIFAGVSAHICPERGFSDQGREEVISHIINVQGGKDGPKTTAPAYGNTPLASDQYI
ncbi:hypothetical protein LTR87_012966 [Friedmanniomyces endolithicus]|nr:hypothetical protein LTR87_012966 [Friedmanniomyces endolithicus]